MFFIDVSNRATFEVAGTCSYYYSILSVHKYDLSFPLISDLNMEKIARKITP